MQLAAYASLAACFDGKRPLPMPIGGLACREAPKRVDYVIVGSGAGGGPLACNLARAGFSVVLLEAGGDPSTWTREIPALHARAAEDESMRWDFWVRTYGSDARQKKNERWDEAHGGILYPRAGTLGGCTAHNALITLLPHESDWNAIAEMFGDESWRASNMRKYWRRLEHCDYAPRSHASGHGYEGWLHTDESHAALAFGDDRLRGIVYAAVEEAARLNPCFYLDATKQVLASGRALWDPNDDRLVAAAAEGMIFVPLHMNGGTRESTRDYIRATSAQCANLHVELGALATRVLFDGERAVGVEYLAGTNLYRACAKPDAKDAERREIHALREVILAGGVFNSPQLLMLSGIGPKKDLAALGIESRVDRPGVGKNLQDRYEMTAVYELDGDLDVLEGARLAPPDPAHPDPAFDKWRRSRNGPYASNGVVGAIVKKSKPALATPDLFVFGIVGNFHGYFRNYSTELSADHKHFSWAVLKAHTMNRAGEVKLRSADPRDTPLVDFHYFDEGSPGGSDDLDAVVEGVMTGRRVMKRFGQAREVRPGPHLGSRRDLAAYIRDNAWGHHASCTNKMGPASDPMAVVDRDFRVHGTTGLRVVDASVFPRIPGFFVVAPTYMLAEKATDAILADAATKR